MVRICFDSLMFLYFLLFSSRQPPFHPPHYSDNAFQLPLTHLQTCNHTAIECRGHIFFLQRKYRHKSRMVRWKGKLTQCATLTLNLFWLGCIWNMHSLNSASYANPSLLLYIYFAFPLQATIVCFGVAGDHKVRPLTSLILWRLACFLPWTCLQVVFRDPSDGCNVHCAPFPYRTWHSDCKQNLTFLLPFKEKKKDEAFWFV